MFYITPLYVVWRNSNFFVIQEYVHIYNIKNCFERCVIFQYIDTYVCTYISTKNGEKSLETILSS